HLPSRLVGPHRPEPAGHDHVETVARLPLREEQLLPAQMHPLEMPEQPPEGFLVESPPAGEKRLAEHISELCDAIFHAKPQTRSRTGVNTRKRRPRRRVR